MYRFVDRQPPVRETEWYYRLNTEEMSFDSAFRKCSAAVLGAQSMVSATAE